MHTLVGTYVQELKAIVNDDPDLELESLWPLKIIIPPTKSRMLYFIS